MGANFLAELREKGVEVEVAAVFPSLCRRIVGSRRVVAQARKHGVEVEMALGEVGEPVEMGRQRRVLARLHQAQMAFRHRDRRVAHDAAEHGDPSRAHGAGHAVAVALAGCLVNDHAGDLDRRVVGGEAARGGGGGLGLAGDVEHEDHGQAEPGGEVGGGAAPAGLGCDAVEQAHGGFDDEQLGVPGRVGGDVAEERRRHGPAIEVDAGMAGGGGVERGVDVVRPGFPRAHPHAAPPQRGQQRQRDGGLTRAGAGGGDDEPACHGRVAPPRLYREVWNTSPPCGSAGLRALAPRRRRRRRSPPC